MIRNLALWFLCGVCIAVVESCCLWCAERITSHPYEPKAIFAPREAVLGPVDAGSP